MKITRREFAASALSAAVLPSALAASAAEDGLRLRFLGTGAADRNGPDERGECRRLTSALLDGKILIDLTPGDLEMLPAGVRPDVIFYTHSHGDHYNPASHATRRPGEEAAMYLVTKGPTRLHYATDTAGIPAVAARIARVLQATERYRPRFPDQKIWLTHMARTLHGSQKEIEQGVPAPLAPAYDGLEVVL